MRAFKATATQATAFFLLTLSAPSMMWAAERGSAGDVYVLEYGHDRVLQLDGTTGAPVGVFAELHYDYGALPSGFAFGGPHNNLFVAPSNYWHIAEFDGNTGAPVRNIPLRAGSCNPTVLAIGPNGNLFVGFHYCSESGIEEYDSQTGAFVGTVLSGVNQIAKMAFSPAGNLYVLHRHPQFGNFIEVLEVDQGTRTSHRVLELASDGERGALAFGAGGELWVTTKFSVFGYNTKDGSERFIVRLEEPIMDIEAGLNDSPLAYVVTEADHVFEIDTANGSVTRRLTADVEGDGYTDAATDGPLDLAIKPQPIARNQPPLTDAGSDQTVRPGVRVALSGAASSDPEGDYLLTYRWEIEQRPAGSLAELSSLDSVVTELAPDYLGDYVIALTVTDSKGAHSQDTVIVSTINAGPVADAGLDIPVVEIGSVVTLNGTGSSDPDGDSLVYSWELLSGPEGSFAQLGDATSPSPQFVADVHGDYAVSLIVEDTHGSRSNRDSVNVSFVNVGPIVVAGPDTEVVAPGSITVTAVATDANLDPVSFCWRMVSRPAASSANLQSTCYEPSGVATLAVDVPGYYVLEVLASDGFVDSAPQSLTIHAKSVKEAVLDALARLRQALLNLPKAAYAHGNKQGTLVHKVDQASTAMNTGDFAQARDHVAFIVAKTDGCADRRRVDGNDWIVSCAAQQAIHPLAMDVVVLLERL